VRSSAWVPVTGLRRISALDKALTPSRVGRLGSSTRHRPPTFASRTGADTQGDITVTGCPRDGGIGGRLDKWRRSTLPVTPLFVPANGKYTLADVKAPDLEEAFLRLALQQSADLGSNVKAANRAYDKLHRLKDRLRLLPDRGEAILKRSASHPNSDVAIIACAALLAVDEAFAIERLESIAETASGFASSTASLTIREWQAGNLSVYWA
jgi:Domain of unknown function (DUF2019)